MSYLFFNFLFEDTENSIISESKTIALINNPAIQNVANNVVDN